MDEIINYVMETPGNTNPNVLRGMLNNSGGGPGSMLIVNGQMDFETGTVTLDKTWQEIYEADCPAVIKMSREVPVPLVQWFYIGRVKAPLNPGGAYYIDCYNPDGEALIFSADSPNDYPSASEN